MKDAQTSPPPIASKPRGLTYNQAAERRSISAVTLCHWRADRRFNVGVYSPTLVRIPIEKNAQLEAEDMFNWRPHHE
jgi:hypothetical protein